MSPPRDPEPDASAPPSFETAIERLEEIVDQLEQGDLELEAALGAFEEGVRLSKHCASELDAADRRIEILMAEGGEWAARPFEPAAGDSGHSDSGDEGDDGSESGDAS